MCKKLVFLVAFVFVLGLAGSVSADPNLVAYWDFETGSGTIAYDQSGYGTTADGTLTGAPTWLDVSGTGITPLGDWALDFNDDTTDWVNCGSPAKLGPTKAVTLAYWTKIDSWTKYTSLVGRYHPYFSRRNSAAGHSADWRTNKTSGGGTAHTVVAGTTNVDDHAWHHVAGTYDGVTGKQYIYIDGVLEDSAQGDVDGEIDYTGATLFGIAAVTGGVQPLDGQIDEVRVYNRALSQAQICTLAGVENLPPQVDAGDDQEIEWPNNTVSIDDASAYDPDGQPDPPGAITLTWSKVSGPCDVAFDPNKFVIDPDVTFDGPGTYILRLTADDTNKTGSDDVAIAVYLQGEAGLVAYYDFETGSGTTLYDQGYLTPADGTLKGDPQWLDVSAEAAPLGNYALDFDAAGDWVDCSQPAKLDITDAITFALWVNVDSWPGNWTAIAGRYHPWYIRRAQAGNKNSAVWTTDGTGCGSINGTTSIKGDGAWHHVAGTYDGATGKQLIYIDGVLENFKKGDVPGTISHGEPQDFGIGAFQGCSVPLDGKVDEVRVYNRQLSWAEVKELADVNENLAPFVKAGDDQSIYWPDDTVTLDGIVEDDGAVTITWSKVSGPCDVNFDPNEFVEDPNATFGGTGHYTLRLTADDGNLSASDDVLIIVIPPGIDPNLIAYYDFETGSGTTVYDQTFYSPADGSITGNPQWVTGAVGSNYALEFDGSGDVVNCGSGAKFDFTSALTVAAWVKMDTGSSWKTIAQKNSSWLFRSSTTTAGCTGNSVDFNAACDANGPPTVCGIDDLRGAWHHVAATYDSTSGKAYLYHDGVLVNSGQGDADNPLGLNAAQNLLIGSFSATPGTSWDGVIDELYIYDMALDANEIRDLAAPLTAWAPDPTGRTEWTADLTLSWLPGKKVKDVNGHIVYFGTDYNDVRDANESNPLGVYKGPDDVTGPDANDRFSYPPGTLEMDTDYYWRVDQVNDLCSVWKGEVWILNILSYLLIDDFEDYEDTADLKDTWKDWELNGSGATIDLETTIALGDQSMEYSYQNGVADVHYSEVERTFDTPQDWTRGGVATLAFDFYGDADNDIASTEQMYVGIKDSCGVEAFVKYDTNAVTTYNGDANDLQKEEWQEWNIRLADFNDAGVDLTDVNKIYVGFGDRTNPPEAGGDGTVYFDNFMLFIPRCLADDRYGTLLGDIDWPLDCIVDFNDIRAMVSDWLETDYNDTFTTVTEPCSANLVAYYDFETGSGTTAYDRATNYGTYSTADGTIYGDPQWVAGKIGNYALDFDRYARDGDVVKCGDPDKVKSVTDAITVSAWVKIDDFTTKWQTIVSKYTSWWLRRGTSPNPPNPALDYPDWWIKTDAGYAVTHAPRIQDGLWHHIAGTYDSATGKSCVYTDGRLADSAALTGSITYTTRELWIGADGSGDDVLNEWNGLIDDVRIYDYALSGEEVAYLATEGTGVIYRSLTSRANISDDEPKGSKSVNFRDFAVLASMWLDEKMFPEN